MENKKYPCITCRRFFITKECQRENVEDCFKCEYNECKNCTQFGNLDCDGDITVSVKGGK